MSFQSKKVWIGRHVIDDRAPGIREAPQATVEVQQAEAAAESDRAVEGRLVAHHWLIWADFTTEERAQGLHTVGAHRPVQDVKLGQRCCGSPARADKQQYIGNSPKSAGVG